MESSLSPPEPLYPEEITKGINPLLFVVNAIPQSCTEEDTSDQNITLFDTFFKALEVSIESNDDTTITSSIKSKDETEDALSAILSNNDSKNKKVPSILKNDKEPNKNNHLRLISVSRKHAFPPSKDPMGNNNTVSQWLRNVVTTNDNEYESNTDNTPVNNLDINGILPSGWLEKHVHALPSCVLVVTKFNKTTPQKTIKEEITKLIDSIEMLRSSLAPKRECKIHLVSLMEEENEEEKRELLDADYLSLLRTLSKLPPSHITALHIPTKHALNENIKLITSSNAYKRLYNTIKESSLGYYLTQARRVKRKYTTLINSLNTIHDEVLFPLAVRYCIKIGVFYEFQHLLDGSKLDKTIKYFLEAYRLMEGYFIKNVVSNKDNDDCSTTPLPGITSPPSVEVTLSTSASTSNDMSNDVVASATIYDMSYQCRTIADWLNYKVLSYYTSNTQESEDSLSSIVNQWRRYNQIFASSTQEPKWYFYKYKSHSYYMFGQLLQDANMVQYLSIDKKVENYNEKIGLLGNIWRLYCIAGEGYINVYKELLGCEGKRVEEEKVEDLHRGRFVGALDSHGFHSLLEEEMSVNYLDIAHYCFEKALEQYDMEHTTSYSKSYIHYLLAQIHYKKTQYKKALECFYTTFELLNHQYRNRLYVNVVLGCVECYKKLKAVERKDVEDVISNLRNVFLQSNILELVSKQQQDGILTILSKKEWVYEHPYTLPPYNTNDPIVYAVTFDTNKTHATSGDVVSMILSLKSNLCLDVCIKELYLYTSLQDTENFKICVELEEGMIMDGEWNDDGLLLRKEKVVFLRLDGMMVPNIDEKANGAAAGFRNLKPRTTGLTRSAGACYLAPQSSQSLSLLGGIPWYCTGLQTKLILSTSTILYICHRDTELAKKSAKLLSSTTTRSTIVADEESYIESAWLRPSYHPTLHGPRVLRILPPIPLSTVVDITSSITNGNLLEGVVNRIVLKLSAGEMEYCHNVQFRILCKHTYTDGFDVVESNTNTDFEVVEDEKNEVDTSDRRTPVLVTQGSSTGDAPSGWIINQQEDYTESLEDSIEPGKSTHVSFELYRPLSTIPITTDDKTSACKTDYEVIFTYHQIRGSDTTEENVGNIVTLYHRGSYNWIAPLAAQFSVISKGPHKTFPCGNRHASNLIDSPSKYARSPSLQSTDSSLFGSFNTDDNVVLSSNDYYSAIDDESIRVRCNLIPIISSTPDVKHSHPAIFIDKVLFENDTDVKCDLSYIPSYPDTKRKQENLEKNTIFSSKCTSGPTLYAGCKFGLSYIVKPRINLQSSSTLDYNTIFFQNHNDAYNVTTSLGIVSIHWNPIPMELTTSKTILNHGPLPLESPATIKFLAPQARVEYAPFEAKLSTFPVSPPKVSTPFHITYSIKNKTPLHQKLSVTMSELPINAAENTSSALSPTSIIEKVKSDGILLSGFINGEVTLTPHETKKFEYCILAIRAGCIMLPTLSVVSLRYNSWVVCDAANPRNLYILP